MLIAEKKTVKRRLLPLVLALVFALLSVPQAALAASFSAIVTADSMPVYSDPGLTKKAGALSKDDVVVVTAYKGGVAQIVYRVNGNKGYARVSDMRAVSEFAEKATVTASNAKVYAKASGSSKATKLKKGSSVYVLATNGDWARIENSGYVGYTYINNLSIGTQPTEAPAATPTPTPAPTANPLKGFAKIDKDAVTVADGIPAFESPDASSKKLGTLDKGVTVRVTYYSADWAYVKTSDNQVGFMPLAGLLPDPPVTACSTAMVAKAAAPLRKTAISTSEVLKTLAKGDPLLMLAYNKSWAFVKTADGLYGYVKCSSLSPAPAETPTAAPTPTPTPTATPAPTLPIPGDEVIVETVPVVTLAKVPVYKSAQTSSTKLGTLAEGAKLTMLACNKTWAYVTLDGKYGYCALAALAPSDGVTPTPTPSPTPVPTPSPTPSLEGAIPATVVAASVTVYKSADTRSTKLGTIKAGQQVNVVAHGNTWAYIELNGKFGYCLLKGLKPTSEVSPSPSPSTGPGDGTVQFEATVIYPNAPVYTNESTTSPSGTLPLGTTVSVYAYSGTWAYVGKDASRGFMQIKHLNKDVYSTLSSGSSGNSVLALQKALEALGYFDGLPAGNYSSLTEDAVSRFQAAVGLPSNGTADQATLRVLAGGYAPASPLLSLTLSQGNSGSNVERLQVRLYYKGYLTKTSSVDADYGSITTSAVKLFQTAAGLSATGKADPATLKKLYSNDAPKNSATAPDAPNSGDGGDGGSTQDKLPDNPTRSEKIEYAIYIGQQQLGKPYVYGATGPNSFDCSGFTTYCFKKVGVSLSRTAYAQGYNNGTKVEGLSDMQRGDIVCMDTISDSDLVDHVGIYLGGGKFIHASSGGGKVMISSLTSGYYNRVFSWGRRVL